MSVIETVRREREELARVLKKYPGIRKIVEDLYPDSAHFIYELLQNAEDTHATCAQFVLTEKSLAFEHDGRPFDQRDIEAITDFGEGTKAGDEDKIGRFGVGFKAVFAYSETPHIWSPPFSFKISELVLPDRLDQRPALGNKTRFEFPFDNLKKDPTTAFAEIEAGLSELAETTLLFLAHLESIQWGIGDEVSGEVLRIKHSDTHYEVLKQSGDKSTSSHFLKFEQSAANLEQQRIAVAFELEFLPGIDRFVEKKKLATQMKISPAAPGQVAVYFPAEKETSGLRFHLHAPFVPELSRASIKDTPANQPLFEQLGSLAAASLHQIRDLGLLTGDFLAVLPNPQDPLPDRYKSIRQSIIEAMDLNPLTPTHAKAHAPARHLLQAKASLKELLKHDDLEFLVDYEDKHPQWAIGAAQKNSNADRFLEGLAIEKWDIQSFVELLSQKTSTTSGGVAGSYVRGPDKEFMQWLSGKPLEWHQQLYALLYTELGTTRAFNDLSNDQVVRLINGEYSVGRHCFFPSDAAEQDDVLPRVDQLVYSSGKSKPQQENARKFLEKMGVREVGEAEQVEAILRQRYTRDADIPDETTHFEDLKRFVSLVERDPKAASLFHDYFVFQGVDAWHTPGSIYLDKPFLDTALTAFYAALGENAERAALDSGYQRCGITLKDFVAFAIAVGVQQRLEIKKASCHDNPNVRELVDAAGGAWTSYGVNVDFQIDGINDLLPTMDFALSNLIWKTLCDKGDDSWATAKYRNNSAWQTNIAPSQLACVLRDRAWIPQGNGIFVRPAAAVRVMLPEGFAFDPGWPWLKAIHFGHDAIKKSEGQHEKQELAKKAGFENAEALNDALQFAALPAEDRKDILAEWKRKHETLLPDHEPSNAQRRKQRVGEQAQDAPKRKFEKRIRSIAIGREEVKEEAAQYLRQEYTNADGVMICQVCKTALPFKLDDGADYFEKVEFLTEIEQRHSQNYLALCPNHGAMFQYANGSRDELQALFDAIDGNHLKIVLAQSDESIYFTKTHIADLRAVIENEPGRTETGDSQ